ncbi:hypothetical protein EYF80_004939 [Liparis tanakae]|uniref:Uncharacterized protein n=1 Tax=Liparis tanakae TaxID=230148 RepID=A0A4Z2J4S6_9TELE|nr:hypothetical protein EYF80_004939 [Liparis tanakae]
MFIKAEPEFLISEATNMCVKVNRRASVTSLGLPNVGGKPLLFWVRQVKTSGVSVWWGSRWCLQSTLHLPPVLTHPSGGQIPRMPEGSC